MASTVQATPEAAVSIEPAPERADVRLRAFLERFSLLIVFALVLVTFSVLRPETFATTGNVTSILDQAAPLIVMAAGLVVVLVMREFDLSIASVAGGSAAVAVSLMAYQDVSTPVAVAAGVGFGLMVGFLNGVLVAIVGIPSFIATLATGSVVAGVETAVANTTIFEGLNQSYINLTAGAFAGIPIAVVVAGVISVLIGTALRFSVFGRHATAIGDNQAAAMLVGLPVTRDRIIAFSLCGGAAGVAGILLTSRAMSYYPEPGAGLLLAAYAATFLSLSLGHGWRFNVLGTVVGVVFLGTITTGLTMLDKPAWQAAVVQGLVLLVAVTALARKQIHR